MSWEEFDRLVSGGTGKCVVGQYIEALTAEGRARVEAAIVAGTPVERIRAALKLTLPDGAEPPSSETWRRHRTNNCMCARSK